MQRYPATLLLYALGLGAIATDRPGYLQFLERIFVTKLFRDRREDTLAVQSLSPFHIIRHSGRGMGLLEGMDQHYAPLNEWIYEAIRPHIERVMPDGNRYRFIFDKFEILMALNFAYHQSQNRYWTVPGAFVYQDESRNRILQEIRGSLTSLKNESPFVTTDIFGPTAERCRQGLKNLEEFIPKLG